MQIPQQLKIAILAAMNIADELLQSEDKKNKLISRVERKVIHLSNILMIELKKLNLPRKSNSNGNKVIKRKASI